jgi:tetratricopeptide (TPR) repeat protein
VAAYGEALRLRPDDAQTHHNLGVVRSRRGEWNQAAADFRRAIALAPDHLSAYNGLADALGQQGHRDEAIAVCRRGITALNQALERAAFLDNSSHPFRTVPRIQRSYAGLHHTLGLLLANQGREDESGVALRKAIEVNPEDAIAHYNLALQLDHRRQWTAALAAYREVARLGPKAAGRGRTAGEQVGALTLARRAEARAQEILAFLREAVRRKPDDSRAHAELAAALQAVGDLAGAVGVYRKVVALNPRSAQAHDALGRTLLAGKNLEAAAAAFRQALALDPGLTAAHAHLGQTLGDYGDLAGAIVAYRKVVALTPNSARAHFDLGKALTSRNDWHSAITSFEKARTIDPEFAPAHDWLGRALASVGQFAEARTAYQRGLELLPPWDAAHEQIRRLRASCDLHQALEKKLPAFLSGAARPQDYAEQLQLAEVCRCTGRYAAAVRFYTSAFATQPQPADKAGPYLRYQAAGAAGRAAAGQGVDAAELDPRERSRLRQLALAWLRAELVRWENLPAGKTPQARSVVRFSLGFWQNDFDLAPLRDEAALADLPEAERAACRRFWADVDTLLRANASRGSGKSGPS